MLSPTDVSTLLSAMEVARAVHGDDPPEREIARWFIKRAAARGMKLTFHRVLNDDGMMVWEIRLDTGRGIVTRQREAEQDWRALLEEVLG